LTAQSGPVTIEFVVRTAENPMDWAISRMISSEKVSCADEQTDTRVVTITVPGELEFRSLVSRAVATVCKLAFASCSDSEQLCNEVVSAVGEAFNNAVFHAYEGTRGDVSLTVSYDSIEVVVELADNGTAFDLKAVPEYLGDDPQESGMGLFIIRNFVDELTYVPGRPNRLRMIKRLPQY
jgi:serine/threonine-protein kinase RsbW